MRLFDTIKYLKPIQIIYRLKNKLLSKKYKRYNNVSFQEVNLFIDGLQNDKEYLNRFETNNDVIYLLNQEVELDYKNIDKYLPLIRYNIEYFEYSIAWAQKGFSFELLKQKWREYIDSKRKLEPYVISLQIPNLIIAMNVYGKFDQEIMDELYSRYRWLLKHQEKHLLANHYFENLKAIVIASYVFNENKVFQRYVKRLKKECREEILDDGVHFELSLMYHKLILEDLLLINRVCEDEWIDEYIQKMITAAVSLEYGFNRTPLFNDAGDNVAKPISTLKKVCENNLGITINKQNAFDKSGYLKIDRGNKSILIDAGYIGPNYNPGHAHCDCFSFELFKDSKPLFVNSGTYQYQGKDRAFFRSTQAHNTAQVDNHEQSNCWGEHRVGKRIKNVDGNFENNSFLGSFVNQFGEKQIRTISLEDNSLRVMDVFENVAEGTVIKSYLHLAPGYSLQGNKIVGFNEKIDINAIDCDLNEIDSVYSLEFGKIENNKCLVFSWKNDNKKHGYCINLNS